MCHKLTFKSLKSCGTRLYPHKDTASVRLRTTRIPRYSSNIFTTNKNTLSSNFMISAIFESSNQSLAPNNEKQLRITTPDNTSGTSTVIHKTAKRSSTIQWIL